MSENEVLYKALEHLKTLQNPDYLNIEPSVINSYIEALKIAEEAVREQLPALFVFSDRMKLADLFNDWAYKNNVLPCGQSLIAYLHINGLLNIDKARNFIKENEK